MSATRTGWAGSGWPCSSGPDPLSWRPGRDWRCIRWTDHREAARAPPPRAWALATRRPFVVSQPFDAAAASAAYTNALSVIESVDPTVAGAIRGELADQRASLK